jgi:hypothetical protein
MKYEQAKKLYGSLHRDVQSIVGADFHVPLVLGNPDEFPMPRNMAYCAYRDHPSGKREIFIVVAPKLIRSNKARVNAILRHELAHAIEFHAGEDEVRRLAKQDGHKLPPGPERRADRIAEIIWDDPIYYDDILVQSLNKGIRPRPRHLGL